MDSITQATLGAAVGELVLGRKLGNRAIGWGALFGTLPDLDILFNPLLDTAGELWWHRGPSHSLLVMVIASLLLARPLAQWWRADRVSAAQAGAFVFLAWSTHVLIDCFNVYGTSVLWPFSERRVAFNNLFIIDPLFTLPMLVALAWVACLRKKPQVPKRRKINAWGLGLASLYVAFSVILKFVASHAFEADLARRQLHYERRMEAPTAFNILLWRSVVEREDAFLIGYRSVLDRPSSPIRWTILPKHAQTLAELQHCDEMHTLKWFSDGWLMARPHKKGAWLADLRFGERRLWDDRNGTVDLRFAFAWDLLPGSETERLQAKTRPEGSPRPMMQRLGLRILGNHEVWDGPPCLEGISGHLAESLDTYP